MLSANNPDLETIARIVKDKDNLSVFERENFPIHNSIPAPQVEFELRHTKEHLEKLKFNWLELHTKCTFLTRLTDTEEWKACQTTRWTPGELKQLEKELEPSKARLKVVKERTETLQRTLIEGCDKVLGLQGKVQERHGRAKELLKKYQMEAFQREELQKKLPTIPIRSTEELSMILDEQSISLEKRTIMVERQRGAIADLERLLAVHCGENAKLEAIKDELESKMISSSKKDNGEGKVLGELCQWYIDMNESLSRLTGCLVEMVKPDYLLATISSNGMLVPVHMTIDPLNGKLIGIKIGSTSSTPKRQWKELIEAAIEFNDIPFLLRSILAIISKK